MSGINQIMSSDDHFDCNAFNLIHCINSVFPTEQSLSNIDDVIAQLKCSIRDVDNKISKAVHNQTNTGKDGHKALIDVQKEIKHLFLQTSEIRNKAEQSEEKVKEITKDIKHLDCAKCNLTTAITTLNHIYMLFSGLNTLRALTVKKQYEEIVMPLERILEVMKYFMGYNDIPQIKKLTSEFIDIQNALSQQINQDFQKVFTVANAENCNPTKLRQLADACSVVNVLDPKVKNELLNWFIGIQLSEYFVLFENSNNNVWLDQIDLRYTWFKKSLLHYEDKFNKIFPPHWEVSERIAIRFCRIIKSQLSKIMEQHAKEIDVKLLLHAIQRTRSFEQLLAVRFKGNTLIEENKTQVCISNISEQNTVKKKLYDNKFQDNKVEVEETHTIKISDNIFSPFHGIICNCFLPYLYIYVESLDKNLFELMTNFVAESNTILNSADPVHSAVQGILPSCANLFLFYKRSLEQCNQLNINGPPMINLCITFKKYLTEFCVKILQNNMPRLSSNTSYSLSAIITRDLYDISSTTSLIPNFLKEENVGFSKAEIVRICCILTSAEYCFEITHQLEGKLEEKVETSLVDQIKMSDEKDLFHSVISNCIQLLVQCMEITCASALSAMNKIQWQTLESIGDQSNYVTALISNISATVELIKDNLFSSRKYFTQFCVRFVNSFIPKFTQNLYKCRPLSAVGAEQLLLNTHTLKTVLLHLPSVGCQVTLKVPASYTKIVVKGMTRAEMIIKVVMTPINPGAYFVEQYLKLLPDSDIQEFQKILEMKGPRTIEKTDLLSIFSSKKTFGLVVSSNVSEHESSSIQYVNYSIKNDLLVS